MGEKMRNKNQQNSSFSAASTTNSKGSTVNSVYGKRTMKVFPVYEQELSAMGYFNTTALAFFSVGSFLLSPLLEIAQKSLDNQEFSIGSGSILLFIVAGLFYGAGTISLFFRHGLVRKIKKQSEEVK